jgi:hypothetical protein
MRKRHTFRTRVGVFLLLVALVSLATATATASSAAPKPVYGGLVPEAPPVTGPIDRLHPPAIAFGDTIQPRLDFGLDGCAGEDRWSGDDLRVYDCNNQPTAVEVSVFATAPAAPRFSTMEIVAAGILVLCVAALSLLRLRRV